jgi:hypothetical protein
MNQPLSPASDPTEPPAGRPVPVPVPVPVDDDTAAAVRLPGLLGRRREGLPVAAAGPLVPTALTAFNRLTGRLDVSVAGCSEMVGDAAVTELSGTPVAPVRMTARDRGA